MGAPSRHVVVMGVGGCGKSTVAAGLSERLGLALADADLFHPQANVAKMAGGIPLTDEDRRPWLRALAAWIHEHAVRGQSTIMACSALRRDYRDVLRTGAPVVEFVHLAGPVELVRARMAARADHFMPPELLLSQYAALEALTPDEVGVTLDLTKTSDELVGEAVALLGLTP